VNRAESTWWGVNKVITRATETPRNAAILDPPKDADLRGISQLGGNTPILRTGAFNPKVVGSIPTRPTFSDIAQTAGVTSR
jgi:hypothetical protein